jgi:hypothetical protein
MRDADRIAARNIALAALVAMVLALPVGALLSKMIAVAAFEAVKADAR